MLVAMRSVAVIAVLAGCGFHGNAAQDMAGPGDARADDAHVADPDAGTTDATPSTFCDPDDTNLVACFEFENDTRDLSRNHLDAQMMGVSWNPGVHGSALHVADNTEGDVADSGVLDVSALTMEAWINPSQLPDDSSHIDVLDVNKQYALYVDGKGVASCVLIGVATLQAPAMPKFTIHTGAWTHIACTFDGLANSILYINGDIAATAATLNKSVATNGTTGLTIGGNNPTDGNNRMTGLIDQLRLFKTARLALQICADAGKTPCL